MDVQRATDALRDLASTGKKSLTAHLRLLFTEIERTAATGVSQATILEQLQAQGLDISRDVFKTTMSRIRKERRAGKETPAPEPQDMNPPPPPSPQKPPESSSRKIFSPLDIRRLRKREIDISEYDHPYKE